MSYANGRWESRACISCGHVRRIMVRDKTKWIPDGTVDKWGSSQGHHVPDGESFNKWCRACELESKARHYVKLAAENRRRAFAERERQQRSKK